MSYAQDLYWPASAIRGDTIAVIPIVRSLSETEARRPLMAAAGNESFCLVRAEDAWRFVDCIRQSRIVTRNAAQLCNLVASAAPAEALRQAIRRYFFQLAYDCRLIDLRLLNGLLQLVKKANPDDQVLEPDATVGAAIPALSPSLDRNIRFSESKFRRRGHTPWSPVIAGHLDLADDVCKAIWTQLGANGLELLAASRDKSLIASYTDSDPDENEIRRLVMQAAEKVLTTPVELNVTSYV
jgi:hypothetical protein